MAEISTKKGYANDVGSGDQSTSLGSGIGSPNMHLSVWKPYYAHELSALPALSCNDPISLVNEVHKLLDHSSSDWPFHVKFSRNNLYVNGIKFMHM